MVLFCPVFFVCTRIPHGAIQIYHFQMDDTNMLNAVSGASVMCSSNITEIHCDTLVQCHPTRPMKPRFNAMRSHWHLRRLGYGEREFVSCALCLLARFVCSTSTSRRVPSIAMRSSAMASSSSMGSSALEPESTNGGTGSLTHSNTARSGCDAFKTIYLCKYVFFVYIHLVTVSG